MRYEIFHALKKVLNGLGLNTAVGDEAVLFDLKSNEQALDVIAQAVANAGYKLGENVTLALDCASMNSTKTANDLAGEGQAFDANGFSEDQ